MAGRPHRLGYGDKAVTRTATLLILMILAGCVPAQVAMGQVINGLRGTTTANFTGEVSSWCQPGASLDCSTGITMHLVGTDLLHGISLGQCAAPTFVDLDGDGDQDLVVGDLLSPKLHYFEHMDDGTFLERTGPDANPLDGIRVFQWSVPTFVDLDRDGDKDLVVSDGSSLKFYYFERVKDGTFLERTDPDANPLHGIRVGHNAFPTFMDLDRDGDLDLVVGDRDSFKLQYFEHVDNGTFLERTDPNANPLHGLSIDYFAVPAFVDLDGDGDQDLVVGDYSARKDLAKLRYFERMPDGTFQELTDPDANPLSGVGVGINAVPTFVTFVDLDGDRYQDLVVGDRDSHKLHHFEHVRNSTFQERIGPNADPLHGIGVGREAAPTFVDLDRDGDQDLVVGDGDSQKLRYLERMHNGTFLERAGPDANPLHGIRVRLSASPTFVDLDHDGDQDLVVGDSSSRKLQYFERVHDGAFLERTDPAANPLHGIRVGYWASPTFADLDGDGDQDLVVGDEDSRKLQYFERVRDGTFLERTDPAANPLHGIRVGGWAIPTFVDLDRDGDLDLVVGDPDSHKLRYFERVHDGAFLERTDPAANPLHGIRVGYFAHPTFDRRELVLGDEDSSKLRSFAMGLCIPSRPCSGSGVCRRLRCTCLEGHAHGMEVHGPRAQCFYCAAGYEPIRMVGERMRCRACAPGESSTGNLTRCTTCGKGMVAPSEGSRCSPCPPGKVPSETRTSCEDCGVGRVATNRFTCEECAVGKVKNKDGTLCQDCPAGRRSFRISQTCRPCPAGKHSPAGSGSCEKCLPGFHSSTGSVECELCKASKVPTSRRDKCEDCPAGRTASPGDHACELSPIIMAIINTSVFVTVTSLLAATAFMCRQRLALRELDIAIRQREIEKKHDDVDKKGTNIKKGETQVEMLKSAIEKGHRWHVKKSKLLKAKAELAKQERKYSSFEAFLDIVEDDDIKLLRGSWLANHNNISRFRRQQDIEATHPEAFWEVDELRSQIQHVHFVIISYCWLHPVNPDPESKHLELIQHALKKRLEVSGEGQVQDIAMVIDYMSLAQHGEDTGKNGEWLEDPKYDPAKQRTEVEKKQFNRALGLLNIPYAHKQVQVWIMQWTPEGHPKYMDRGWPFFEQAVAGLVKDTTKLVLLQREALASESWDDIYNVYRKSAAVSHQRIPPLLPSAFEEEIKKRKFTNGKNPQAFVAGLYKRTFEEVIGNAEVLWFVGLAWGNNHAKKLALVLGECKHLKQLLVCNNLIGIDGALDLVKAASKCETLELLDMTGNTMSNSQREELNNFPRRMELSLRVDGKRHEGRRSELHSRRSRPSTMISEALESEVRVQRKAESERKTERPDIEMAFLSGARARTTTMDTGTRASSSSCSPLLEASDV